MPEHLDSPPPIMCDKPGSFAWSVLHDRHPALIQRVLDAIPYPPERRRRLDKLLEQITTGVIGVFEDTAQDKHQWHEWARPYLGKSWFDTPFLWVESYFYRVLLAAVGYFDEGAWRHVDPFGPFKSAELHSSAVDDELGALDELPDRPTRDVDDALLRASVWGNRADLGFGITASEPSADPTTTALLVDDSRQLWAHLDDNRPGKVCMIADNAGRELLPDLVLVDHLLRTGRAAEVELHVKPYPYYVSDATIADVLASLRRLSAAQGRAGETGRHLCQAIRSGTLTLATHPFWCAPLPFHEMPDELRQGFGTAALTICKGDLNYRRLLDDRAWPPTTSFTALAAHFPSPVAALRTLKSDVIAGLDEHTVDALDATGSEWRTDGVRAVVQVRL